MFQSALLSALMFLFAAASTTAPPSITPTDWYIRVDGGTRYDADVPTGQCDGKHDAAYPGSGVNQPCAFSSPAYLLFDGVYTIVTKPIIQGGDRVHIGPGQFRVGYLGPNPNDHDGMTIAGNPFNAALPGIPGGTATHPTTFTGAGIGKTQIYGGYGTGAIFDLTNAAYVTITDMELTDHGSCTRVGVVQTPACYPGYPLSDYAEIGIQTSVKTHDLTLTNLNIHGLVLEAMGGPIGGLVTIKNVQMNFNGSVGWNFDDGNHTPNAAGSQVNATKLVLEGNGCNEEYPLVHSFPALTCYDQNSGGYGDGVGTQNTPLNFTCDQCTFAYNTQDGADLLHTSGSIIRITNSQSYGNMGQQWKFGAMTSVVFENNRTVHNCSRMSAPFPDANAGYNKYLTNFCRAGGDGFAMAIMDGGTYVLQNNSYAGYGATTYDISCGGTCTQQNIVFQNNLHIGYANPLGGQTPGIFYFEAGVPANPFKALSNNIYFNMRSLPADGVGTDPHIADEPAWKDETSLDAIDFHLTAQSANATGKGVAVSGLTTDADGVTRPATPSIGAYELVSGGSTVTTPPPSNGGGTTTTPPPNNGGATVTTPPPVTTPASYDVNIQMTCTPSGTQMTCVQKTQ